MKLNIININVLILALINIPGMKTDDSGPRVKKDVLILFGRVTMEDVVLGKSGSMRPVLDNKRLPVGGNRVL